MKRTEMAQETTKINHMKEICTSYEKREDYDPDLLQMLKDLLYRQLDEFYELMSAPKAGKKKTVRKGKAASSDHVVQTQPAGMKG